MIPVPELTEVGITQSEEYKDPASFEGYYVLGRSIVRSAAQEAALQAEEDAWRAKKRAKKPTK